MKHRSSRIHRLVSGSFFLVCGLVQSSLAGSYVQNFNSIANGSSNIGDGSVIRTNNAGVTNVFQGSNWKALRLTQDTTNFTYSNFFLPNLEPTHTMSSFSATFDLLIKNNEGTPADTLTFNVGTMKTTNTYFGTSDSGMYDSSGTNTGPVLSIVWDTYDNGNDPNSIQVFLNGTSLANSTTAGKTPYVSSNLDLAGFRSVSIQWTNNKLSVSYGGQSIFSNLSTGSFKPALGDTFAFAASTGGANQDVFLDNINITTVPEPSSLLLLGLGTTCWIRRRKR